MRVALVTERRYAAATAAPDDWYLRNILQDDALLQEALKTHGIQGERVDWAREGVDWSRYDAAVIRTTWDYFDRVLEFRNWLDHVSRVTKLINSRQLIEWNFDKHYLTDLQSRGVDVVPSIYLGRSDTRPLLDYCHELGWQEAVIKPCISGGARLTYRLCDTNVADVDALLRPHRAEESFMLQPFIPSILTHGEVTLMLFAGRYTHAIRKVAKEGDFRVQDDHGGRVLPYHPTEEEVHFAERCVQACPEMPVYARVDLVRDKNDRLCVMELEAIEPELWIRFHPPSAAAFANAIVSQIG